MVIPIAHQQAMPPQRPWLLPACVVASLALHAGLLLSTPAAIVMMTDNTAPASVLQVSLSPAGPDRVPGAAAAPSSRSNGKQPAEVTRPAPEDKPVDNAAATPALWPEPGLLAQADSDTITAAADADLISTRDTAPTAPSPQDAGHVTQQETRQETGAAASKPLLAVISDTGTGNVGRGAITSQDDSAALNVQRAWLTSRIRDELHRHLHYPTSARRRGWEGDVLLGFKVRNNGMIDNIHVSRSSGFRLLDESALLALRKIKAITWPHSPPEHAQLDMEIPVFYRLRDG